MPGTFRKISRVRNLTGGTQWYLSDDCLLAAKVVMYAVEYRRFYLRDLESVVVWPSRSWWLRMVIPGGLLALVGASFWHWVGSTAAAIFAGSALAWVALELALGPTAKSRISTTGATVDLPLVGRARRAPKVLARIDAAVRATRVVAEHPSAITAPAAETPLQDSSEASPPTSIADVPETNAS